MGLFEVERKSLTSTTFEVVLPGFKPTEVLYTPADALLKSYTTGRNLPDFTVGADMQHNQWQINPDKFLPNNYLKGFIQFDRNAANVFLCPNTGMNDPREIATITQEIIMLNLSSGNVEIDSSQTWSAIEKQLSELPFSMPPERVEKLIDGILACAVIGNIQYKKGISNQ